MKAYAFPIVVFILIGLAKYLERRSKLAKSSGLSESISGLSRNDLALISLKPLLTPTELKFSYLLDEAMPELRVMYQVAVYQTIKIKDGSEKLKIWNKLSRLTFDFVLIDKESNIVAVIELDDKSHLRAASVKRDQKKDDLIKFLGKPLLRFNVSDMPSVESLKTAIRAAVPAGE